MKHFIIVKWNEKVTDKEAFYLKACEAFKDITAIDGISSLEVHKSNSDRSNRFDVMIEIGCSQKGLENYDASDLHKNWKANFSDFMEKKAIFDHD